MPECDGEGQGAKAPELTCQDCKNKENKLKKWENERGKCRGCCWPWRREESWPGRRWNFTAGFSERGTGSRMRTANELQERPRGRIGMGRTKDPSVSIEWGNLQLPDEPDSGTRGREKRSGIPRDPSVIRVLRSQGAASRACASQRCCTSWTGCSRNRRKPQNAFVTWTKRARSGLVHTNVPACSSRPASTSSPKVCAT